ncbi:hypothetical protein [Thermodesulfatator indicus]|nr:hypothetical protein [Thermodesulfatator indicus]
MIFKLFFLTSAQVRRIQALADLKIAYAKLLYATGLSSNLLEAP